MTMETGRLLKKNNKELLEKVEIEEFKFLDFNQRSHMLADNPRKSVVLIDHHDPREINSKVKNADVFKTSLGPKSQILTPVDLQKDYELSQKEMMIKKRRRLLDEEEAIAQELAELVLSEDDKKKESRWAKIDGNEGEGASEEGVTAEENEVKREVKEAVAANAQVPSSLNFGENTPSKHSQNHPAHPAHPISLTQMQMEQGLEEIKRSAHDEGRRSGFEEGYDAGFQEGRVAGETEGFKIGEERGLLEGAKKSSEEKNNEHEEKSERYFKVLTKSIEELANLRHEVLGAGQEIFLEITKVAAEKLLRTQLRENDAPLKKLFENAIKAYAEKEFISLEINPSDAQRLKSSLDEKLLQKLKFKENDSLEEGDFKVEVDSEVMVFELRKAVENLVDGLRGEIFNEDEAEADSSSKAG